MTWNRKESPISVGIVVRDASLAERARDALAKAGMTTAFDHPLASWGDGRRPAGADVVLFAGLLESREDSDLDRLRDDLAEVPLVAFGVDEDASTLRSFQNRADGLVSPERLEETLALTVQGVVAGLLVVPRGTRRRSRVRDITNREKQVLSLVIMGFTNFEIAEKLYISESTVKSHLNTAYRKLGVHSRAEAVRVIADPEEGLGTGILAITGPGLARGRPQKF